jgi:polyadenylation factor subunit 2
MQAHEEGIFCATYSHNNEWLLSGDKAGCVKYWQTNFNNVQEIEAEAPDVTMRDIAFAPTDSKFVTASDEKVLKVWDFATAENVGVLEGHTWDVKCADWHPSKGLIVSGSKDHLVKLWDPRYSKCLTTLHGHKNTLSTTKFEPTNGVLLATTSREPIVRVFDLRMMRDVFLLKHESQGVTALTWHPIHSSLLTTGTSEGGMNHFLLDEPNAPAGTPSLLSPYDSETPEDAPAQTIWPAHRIPFAHENIIWSMEWHPLGHILASGGNDRVTRFWTRPRPGESSYLNDRWHIGLEAAEKRGTWKSKDAQRQREEEEADDEADGLIDQQMPAKQQLPGCLPGLPGLPGLAARPVPSFPDGTSTGGAQTQPLPGFTNGPASFPPPGAPPLPPGMDFETLRQALAGGQLPQPPLPGSNVLPPMPPNFQAQLPPNFQPPPGFPMPQNLPGVAGTSGAPSPGGGGAVRKRAPLPDQAEALQEEMRQGRYTRAR